MVPPLQCTLGRPLRKHTVQTDIRYVQGKGKWYVCLVRQKSVVEGRI